MRGALAPQQLRAALRRCAGAPTHARALSALCAHSRALRRSQAPPPAPRRRRRAAAPRAAARARSPPPQATPPPRVCHHRRMWPNLR